jgi:hypothetical protein
MGMPRSTAEAKQFLTKPTYEKVVAVTAFMLASIMNAMSDGNNTAALLLTGLAAFGLHAIANKPQVRPALEGLANRALPATKTEAKKVKTEIDTQPQPTQPK